MFSRNEKRASAAYVSGLPTHDIDDENKYAKAPMSFHNGKKQPRRRIRKRHAALVLCLCTAMVMFLKSHSVSVGFSSSSSSSGLVQQGRQEGSGGVMAGINKPLNRAGVPAPVIPNNPAPVQVQDNGNTVDPAAAAAAARKKKKKEKKQAAISLFEFPGDDEKPAKKNNNNKSKAQKDKKKKNDKKKPNNNNKPSAPKPASPPPSVPKPVVPPVVAKPQHDWSIPQEQDAIGGSVGGIGAEPQADGEGDQTLMDDEDGENLVDEEVIPKGNDSNNRLHNQDSDAAPGGARTGPLSPPPHVNPAIWEERKNRVKAAFLHSWNAYKRDAWGKDEYHPITKYGSNMIRKGQGFTIVDSLDTILLMGLEKEFQEAKEWVRNELDFDQDGEVNLFETTIRVLGGLLSAYDQSGKDPIFLRKAVDLADRLMGAFETPTGIPYASVHLRDRRGVPGHDRGISSTAEVASLQLEFKYLSYLTGDERYWKAAENVVLKIKEMDSLDGLVPIYINPNTGHFQGGEIRLGSRGDSYYEYLIKQYLQTGKKEKVYKEMYDEAIAGVKKHLLGRTIPNHLLFVGEISKYNPKNLSPKMDHLVCFLGGTLALGSTSGHSLDPSFPRSHFSPLQESDFKMGEELTESCYEMYRQTETGLAAEIVYWVQNADQIRGKTVQQHAPGSDFIINDRDGHNWLRPETAESLFYLWRLTGDDKYRHWGWNIFEAIEKYSKVASGGYSSIHDIRQANNINFSDKMETFFLAETLKYFFLLFGPDNILPLDEYVFNTEAHPLPIFEPPTRFLARTAPGSSERNGVMDEDVDVAPEDEDEVGEELSEEDRKYKEMLAKEDNDSSAPDDEEEIVGAGDTVEEEEGETTVPQDDEDDEEGAQSEGEPEVGGEEATEGEEDDEEVDQVDQGLEDLAVDDAEDDGQGEEVAEVEVDYEEGTDTGEEEEEEEEEGEEGEQDGEEGEQDGEEGEGEEEGEEEEGEEAEEEEEEEEEMDGEDDEIEPGEADDADVPEEAIEEDDAEERDSDRGLL
ncbi:mannosyl-oligosaccharide alpha-1,2-mannosidase [Linnemannia schmuckeri]|uniref:alpha-1,2-Mannosidase n=1 Tax=Linnemannia schmuckeri TaxID=64567 RepID=A0A9P5VFL9_9FUNG|nr:mannosyl-oligosaccharide alpha-1,2-mannosidase [Linnemannia schmuckeri]